ncbi:TetR/AcrR family transcriptional regulator [Flavobacterium sp.]|uniref:TetR/AcrR family transcriptional regulator n=1 Tax=Flavobacterium sp. TaxID=239 RepID=UPI00262CD77F|nr:TetR/AcrR family transcriptional regulator [Flavobacterium sp.]
MSTIKRKEREKELRREAILSAATDVMLQYGLYGLNLDLVAKKSQLAKGTLYLYFKSKEEILATLTLRARQSLTTEFLKIHNEEIGPIEKLRKVINANFEFFKKQPLYFDLVSLYEANHSLNEEEELYKSSEEISLLVFKIISDARESGLIREDIDPMTATMNLWASTVGTLQLIKVRGSLIDEKFGIKNEVLFNSFMEIFIQGISKK